MIEMNRKLLLFGAYFHFMYLILSQTAGFNLPHMLCRILLDQILG